MTHKVKIIRINSKGVVEVERRLQRLVQNVQQGEKLISATNPCSRKEPFNPMLYREEKHLRKRIQTPVNHSTL